MRGRRLKAESGGAILDPADVEARRLLYILGVRTFGQTGAPFVPLKAVMRAAGSA